MVSYDIYIEEVNIPGAIIGDVAIVNAHPDFWEIVNEENANMSLDVYVSEADIVTVRLQSTSTLDLLGTTKSLYVEIIK